MLSVLRSAAIVAALGLGMLATPILADDPSPVPAQPAEEIMEGETSAEVEVSVAPENETVQVGDMVKDFSLTDIDGKTHSLSDYEGKIIVLSWTNPDCPFIVDHNKKRTVDALAEKYADKDVVVLQIDSTHTGTTERLVNMREEYDVKSPILEDYDGSIGRYFGAKTSPHVFVIDTEGKLVYSGAIDNAPMGKLNDGESENVNYAEAVVEDLLAGREVSYSTTKPYGCSVKYADAP
ncbi:MAG: Thiol-disulfide oxidoreductase ResA [candidate division BRC1 bacterium ADurb.BinA292]|nr:MAG: Thiol-disulfide oxidoreductase ResA [candidate division BRC1 bacterium ADurb.BinA292]